VPENIDRLARSCTESGIGGAVQAASGFVNVWPFGHRFGMSNEHQSPAYIPPIALCYYAGDLSVCLALDGDSCLD